MESISPAFLDALARGLGVTRVARVTGLDRTGVEVACAVRPGGHVLQVCNGKGLTFEAAARGALFETAELWAAETVRPERLRWGSRTELERTGDTVWGVESLGSAGAVVAPRLAGPAVRLSWCEARTLAGGGRVWVPAQGVYCPPAGTVELGPVSVAWTTNGSGAHPESDAALLHALLEATERDQLSRALPEGWSEEGVVGRMLRPETLEDGAPRTAALRDALKAQGFQAYLFDVTPAPRTRGRVGLPVAAAVLVDADEGPVPLTAGYACAMDRDEALLKALLEAAQSRLTDIHGAREDVAAADREAALGFAQALSEVRPRREVDAMPDAMDRRAKTAAAKVRTVLSLLDGAGFKQVAGVALDAPVPGLHVWKVVVPGMRVSELL
ncbi:YcaO-like fatty acid binding domain-containing protein [Corallococcus coralloides DSM 2259]|uniref:YcaO-like fatty acid binding domain-containing protein n=1 Tax=Corallococcus coralloides (strain ATCC 25202 / DSM 2259 / NBRC 100086 / M2) TaxID=1144275 RepID=H8N280_CORCM|nr:YcaO-like family protein [Corallococcus coralloides]AFE06512.1 YcaO-like fatty acid binding domain-containing protein [Corallococcus coralloides DSM 2259]